MRPNKAGSRPISTRANPAALASEIPARRHALIVGRASVPPALPRLTFLPAIAVRAAKRIVLPILAPTDHPSRLPGLRPPIQPSTPLMDQAQVRSLTLYPFS